MNIKPTPEQVREWVADAFSKAPTDAPIEVYEDAVHVNIAELAAQWGASQAQQTTPQGFVLVPLVPTRAMEYVMEQEDWQWADLLAAANAVTEEQYEAAQAQQTTVEEPELPEAFAVLHHDDGYFTTKQREHDLRYGGPRRTKVYTATQMHDHFAAGVQAGAAGSQDAKRYRFWRSLYDIDSPFDQNAARQIERAVTPEQLDAAIDAAMQGDKQ